MEEPKWLYGTRRHVSPENFLNFHEVIKLILVLFEKILRLILLYINDLQTSLITMPRLFADDTALLIHESSFSRMKSLAES